MKVKTPEVKFRKFLALAMAPYWKICWHEDREITPGVPDLHYIVNPTVDVPHPRLGWLELKASDLTISKIHRIRVEPSQRQWIREWKDSTQINFLIRIKRNIYLLDADYYGVIADFENEWEIGNVAIDAWTLPETADKLPHRLRELTRRP